MTSRPRPSDRERVYHALLQHGGGGATASTLSLDTALLMNFVLVALRALKQSGAIEQLSDGKWRITPRQRA